MSGNGFVIAGDGWVQVTPCGEFPHAGAGVTQVVDREACDRIAAEFAGRRADPNFPGVLVDFDHFSLDTDKSSEAAGWITELEARDTGLWARVRWSDSGLAAVQGGRFRLVSPVFPAPGACEDLGSGRIRPVKLVSVALTNEPNIKGGRPIANRGTVASKQSAVGSEENSRGGAEARRGEVGTVGNRQPATGNGESLTANGANQANGARGGAEALSGKDEPKGDVMSGPGAKRFMWLLGDPPKGPHCGECVSRNGQVKTLLEWLRMSAPKCHCYCRLAEVGKDVPEGYDPTAVTLNLGNRWPNPWGDKARAASLAVRRAKAAARKSVSVGTYPDGQPVIRDLTDLPEPSRGVSLRDAGEMEARQAAYAEAFRRWLEGVDAVAGGIEDFNALVASAGGAAVAAAGGAAPAGAASRAYGVGSGRTSEGYGRRSPGLAAKLRSLAGTFRTSAPRQPASSKPVRQPDRVVEAAWEVEHAKEAFRAQNARDRAALIEAIVKARGSGYRQDGEDLAGLGVGRLRDYLTVLGGRPDLVVPAKDVPARPGDARGVFEDLKSRYGVEPHTLRTPAKYQKKATPAEIRAEFTEYLKETLGERRGNVDQNLRDLEVYQREAARAVFKAKDALREAQHRATEARRAGGEVSPEYAKAAKAAEDALWDFEHASRVSDSLARDYLSLKRNLDEYLGHVKEGSPLDWSPADRDYNRLLEQVRTSGAALGNRWKYGWGDAARAASLAVRKAKAAARAANAALAEFLFGGIVQGKTDDEKEEAPAKVKKTVQAKPKGVKSVSKGKRKRTGSLMITNRWYTHWGDKARAASLAVRRAKAAARAGSGSGTATSSGGTYPDGTPVIRDLTDLPAPTGGYSFNTPDPTFEQRQADYAEAFRRWWGGVETSAENIEKFHAYVAAFGGAAAAAAGAARPAGEATGLFGATGGRYGGQKPVYDQSGNVVGWARVGGRAAAARRGTRSARGVVTADPLNNPQTSADLAVRESYGRHLETVRRGYEREMAAKGLDPQGYPLAGSGALRSLVPAAAAEAMELYGRLAEMPVHTAEDREAYQAAAEGLRRFGDLYDADMLERAEKEGILPKVRALLEGENLDGQPRGSPSARESGADYPAEDLPWFAPPPGVVKESAAPYGGGLSAGAAREAARALGVLHGTYGVGEDGVEIPEALRGEYDLGRAEGAKGYDYGIVTPKDRAAVLRGAQAYLDGAVGEDDGYAPDHLNDRYNLADWDSAASWATRNQGKNGVYDPRTPDTRGQYNPVSLMSTAMTWFGDAMVRGDRGESNAALSYMGDLLTSVAADRKAVTEAVRNGPEENTEEGDEVEIDAAMPEYDADGVEVGGEPFYEDSHADPNALPPWWRLLGNRWSDAARAASLAVRRAKSAARKAAGAVRIDGPLNAPPQARPGQPGRDGALSDELKRKRRRAAKEARIEADRVRLQGEREERRERRNSPLKAKFERPGLQEESGQPGMRKTLIAATERVDRDRPQDKPVKGNAWKPSEGFSVPAKGAVFYYNGNFYDGKGNWISKTVPSKKSGAVWQNGLWYDAATGKTLGRTVAAS